MHRLFTTIVSLLIIILAHPAEVTVEQAQKAGITFLNSITKSNFKSSTVFVLTLRNDLITNGIKNKSTNTNPEHFYLFDINDGNGFLLMSADDVARPVLGYSLKKPFNNQSVADAFYEMLQQYENEMAFASKNNFSDAKNKALWESLLMENNVQTKSATALSDVAPLLTTQWSQSPYYNAQCPKNSNDQRAITGCVATAMAQVMNYHEFPRRGQGFHDYSPASFPLQSLIFGNYTYNWSQMPSKLNGSSTQTQINAVALLMHHCGVAVNMHYGIGASGATMSAMANGLKKYFSYNEKLRIKSMLSVGPEAWKDTLFAEINAGRPVLYAGFGASSGHAFILDGYMGDLFHINWGWGGTNDGYFALTALNPSAYPSGFNYYQQGILGVEPDSYYKEHKLVLSQPIGLSSDTLYTSSPYNVYAWLKNSDSVNFTGDVAFFFFDNDTAALTEQQIKWNISIAAGDSTIAPINFSEWGMYLPEGKYLLGIFYRTLKNNWLPAAGEMYGNFREVVVLSSDSISSFTLVDSIAVNPQLPIENDSLLLKFKIKNRSTKTFNGTIKAKLLNSWGNILSIIDSLPVVNIATDSTFSIELKADTLPFKPMRYSLSIYECPQHSTNEYLIHRGIFTNPVPIDIQPIPPKGDAFEPNDNIGSAVNIPVNITANFNYYFNDSLSIHLDTDLDWFKIGMPSGPYKYSVWISAEELNKTDKEGSNQNDRENGILSLRWFDGSTWSEPMNGNSGSSIPMEAGDTIWFEVFPFFTGLTTNYSLAVYVSRSIITENSIEKNQQVAVYPVPASDILTIKYPDNCTKCEIFDAKGVRIKVIDPGEEIISVSSLKNGLYFIRFAIDNDIEIRKTFVIMR
jgi:hypothetical protein